MADISAASIHAQDSGAAAPRRAPLPPTRLLAAITLGYVACAFVFLIVIGGNPVHLMLRSVVAVSSFFELVRNIMPLWLVAAILGVLGGVPGIRRRLWQNRTEILLSVICSSILVSVFGLVKNHLPVVMPFWADPLLTRIDAVTSFKGLYAWLDRYPTDALLGIYFNGWVLVATFLPAFLCMFERNDARRRMFTILWAACWIGLGNLLAVAFMSAGPIFLDHLGGSGASAYGDVMALLQRPDAANLLMVKTHLWNAHAAKEYMIGSGISAFPSVHVGMAAVVALYLFQVLHEQAGRMARPAAAAAMRGLGWAVPVALVLVFQVLSVYLGWHYAVDGYVSIAVIWGLYRGLGGAKSIA